MTLFLSFFHLYLPISCKIPSWYRVAQRLPRQMHVQKVTEDLGIRSLTTSRRRMLHCLHVATTAFTRLPGEYLSGKRDGINLRQMAKLGLLGCRRYRWRTLYELIVIV
ncbi:hypothetical protein J3E69DRAFT_337288 [Trichoderma sp. SZMC 28015]